MSAAHVRHFLMLVAVALALGGCSKCAVPDFSGWWRGNSAPPPASCHGDPPAQ